MTSGHIRPKVRKAPKKLQAIDDAGLIVEPLSGHGADVRHKVDSWMGVHQEEKKSTAVPPVREVTFPHTISGANPMNLSHAIPEAVTVGLEQLTINNSCNDMDAREKVEAGRTMESLGSPKTLQSILKTSKYSNSKVDNSLVSIIDGEKPQQESNRKKSVFKHGLIQEKDPTLQPSMPQIKPPQAASMAVEGYVLSMDHNKRIPVKRKDPISHTEKQDGSKQKNQNQDENSQEVPLVFNSLADMMDMAGTLPSQDLKSTPQVVEADLEFSCMTREEFQSELFFQGMVFQEIEKAEKMEKEFKKVAWKTSTNSLQNFLCGCYMMKDILETIL